MIFLDSGLGWAFDLSQFDSVWALMVQLLLVLLSLLLGNVLRRIIPFLRKGNIPSALIGGLLLFLFELVFRQFGFELIDRRVMQILTYHTLAIGFIAMTLKHPNKKTKITHLQSVQNGALTGGAYMLQAALGIITSLVFVLFGSTLFYDSGVLLPLAFGQGPGNALTWDINFTVMEENTFNGQGSVGLTLASIGFIVASIGGVIYINYFKHKHEINPKVALGEKRLAVFEGEDEIEDSDSVDKLSIQVAFVAAGYTVAFLIMVFFAKLSDWTNIALFNSVVWGFNFIWGVIAATLIKLLLILLRKKKVVKKEYINNYQMDRISGFAFDVMIVAGVAAIDIQVLKDYALLIAVLTVVGTISTIIYVRKISRIVFKDLQHECFLMNFPALTGTASNGIIFLREIDPNYETPMSMIYTRSQLPAMLFVAPLLLLLNLSASSLTGCIVCLIIFAVLFTAYTIFLLLSAKNKKKK